MEYTKIKNRRDLSLALGVPPSELTYVLYKKGVDQYYSSFLIPKKSGGNREIDASKGALKYIQRRLVGLLWERQNTVWSEETILPNIAHAFQKKKSIMTNANVHKNKRYVVNLDLENFFGSIHFGRVKGFFEKNRYFCVGEEVATVIAQLVCYKGRLPQGAPSSPIITNLICGILDIRLLKLAKKYRLDYTRYADDMTFSTNSVTAEDYLNDFIADLAIEVEHAGFKINERKTRVIYRNSRQEVTGLVVNKRISVKRDYYKLTRAMAANLYKENEFTIGGTRGTITQLEGRFAFINQIDKWNRKMGVLSKELTSREEQYKKFLVYKYFFATERPVIITEGKTDVQYLKAALKANAEKYPDLVSKTDNDKFKFKISFFNRTKRIKHFFGSAEDGADAIKPFVLMYGSSKDAMIEWFKQFTGNNPCKPVILIFDNEDSKEKPLSKMIGTLLNDKVLRNKRKANDMRSELNEHGKMHVKDNLFFATTPKNANKDCEIENLFNKNKLDGIRINGRTYHEGFEKSAGWDPAKHFSKNVLSLYVLKDYKNINFEGFIPLLDAINSIVKNDDHY